MPLQRSKTGRAFSGCTTAPREGMVSGRFPLDPFHMQRPEAKARGGPALRGRGWSLNKNRDCPISAKNLAGWQPPDKVNAFREGWRAGIAHSICKAS